MKSRLFFTAILSGFAVSTSLAQSIGTGVSVNVQNNDDFTGYEMLDSAIRNARVVMTGENHTYVKFNAKMELKMLRLLNQKTGTRNFVIELGAARAHYINRYINESDTMADRFLRATTSPRYMELFKRMRKFNMALPDSLKIKVWGIDVERFNDLPLIRLSELMPRENVPANLRVCVDAIHGASDWIVDEGLKDYEEARDESASTYQSWRYRSQPFYIGPSIKEFIRYYDSLKTDFQNWLGSDFAAVDQAAGWLREYQQWKKYENTTYQYVWREENIYLNLSGLVKKYPGERFYGQFGRCHIAYEEQNGDCGWYGYHSVINKLQTRYFKSQDSVLTIGLFYSGNGDNNYYSDREDDKDLQKEIDHLLETAEKKSITLFNLHDSEADLPRLGNKFSFAIVNDNVDPEDEDSADSEIITKKIINTETGKPSWFFTLGFTTSTVNTGVLGNHIASNGYSTELGAFNFSDFTLGYQGLLSHEFRISGSAETVLHSDLKGVLKYSALFTGYRVGYPIHIGKWQLNPGLGIQYGHEKVQLTNDNTSFLQKRGDKVFVHSALVAGPGVVINYRIGNYFIMGMHGSRYFDFSLNQWNYKGSSQPYGRPGEVSAGFSGYYIGFSLGFIFPLTEDEYNYYD